MKGFESFSHKQAQEINAVESLQPAERYEKIDDTNIDDIDQLVEDFYISMQQLAEKTEAEFGSGQLGKIRPEVRWQFKKITLSDEDFAQYFNQPQANRQGWLSAKLQETIARAHAAGGKT